MILNFRLLIVLVKYLKINIEFIVEMKYNSFVRKIKVKEVIYRGKIQFQSKKVHDEYSIYYM